MPRITLGNGRLPGRLHASMRPLRNAADHSLYVTPCFKMDVLWLCERSKLYVPPMHDTRKHSRIVGGFRHIFKELSAQRALPGFLLAPERSHLWSTKKTDRKSVV